MSFDITKYKSTPVLFKCKECSMKYHLMLTPEEARALDSFLVHHSGHADGDPILDKIQEKLLSEKNRITAQTATFGLPKDFLD